MKKHKSISLFIRLAFVIVIIIISASCRHRKTAKKNGKTVEITEKTVFVDSHEANKYLANAEDQKEFGPVLAKFYKDNSFLLAWDELEKPGGLAEKFISKLDTSDQDGLDPMDFSTLAIRDLMKKANTVLSDKDSIRKDLDILLSTEFVRYAAQMREGITRRRKKEFGWVVRAPDFAEDSLLKIVLTKADQADPFAILLPPHSEYLALRKALRQYKEAEEKGSWQSLSGFISLKKGDVSIHVAEIRENLALHGDYSPGEANVFNPRIFDENMAFTVKNFQTRNGIEPDGIVAGKTLKAMNLPISERIKQIKVNMEKWRMIPAFGERYLKVNVPEFRLYVNDSGHEVFQMRTVVGKEYKSTPVFNENMKNIVFSPYWNIPNSITESDIIPAMHRNPGFIAKNHMEAVNGFDTGAGIVPYWMVRWADIKKPGFHYRLRQRPGKDNPLGLVKFMFPNNFNVYLHGTSSPGLFQKVIRTYSHGCIRIEDPVKLASFLLRDQPDWTSEKIIDAMNGGHEMWISIKPMPVFILYVTSWVDKEGKMQFRDDIYGLDKIISDLFRP